MANSWGSGDPLGAYELMRRQSEEEMRYRQMAMLGAGPIQMQRSLADAVGIPRRQEPDENPVLLLLK